MKKLKTLLEIANDLRLTLTCDQGAETIGYTSTPESIEVTCGNRRVVVQRLDQKLGTFILSAQEMSEGCWKALQKVWSDWTFSNPGSKSEIFNLNEVVCPLSSLHSRVGIGLRIQNTGYRRPSETPLWCTIS